jgi:Ca2+/H+ antiporter, TMEM165/GDT1 family
VSPAVIAATFVAVFFAELPDKTMFATMVLSARYRRARVVWAGAALAFTLQVGIAVVGGGLLSRLPERAVAIAAGVLFAAGAVVLLRESDPSVDDGLVDEEPVLSTRQIFLRTFGVVFVAELGDLTQLASAGLAASTGQPIAVFVGAVVALWCAAGVAVLAGERVLSRLPVVWVRRVAAAIFAALSLLAFVEAARS